MKKHIFSFENIALDLHSAVRLAIISIIRQYLEFQSGTPDLAELSSHISINEKMHPFLFSP